MALQEINYSELPKVPSTRDTSPKVSISASGQMRPNRSSIEPLNGDMSKYELAQLFFDADSRQVGIKLYASPPKGKKKEELVSLSFNKDKEGNRRPNIPPYFSATEFLHAQGYEYKASGNQSFKASPEANMILFTLPQGALAPKPKQARKRKTEETQNPQEGAIESQQAA